MKSLFEPEACQEVLERLENLREDARPQWGKMTVGQMAWHCQVPLRVALKNKPPRKKPNPLIALFFKKSLYNDRPWRKNLPTAPFAKAREPKELSEELPKLKQMVQEVHELKDRREWQPHPLFGTMTPEQWGKMQYKHLDHHLTQFGV
jgi:hypothetical protein